MLGLKLIHVRKGGYSYVLIFIEIQPSDEFYELYPKEFVGYAEMSLSVSTSET